MSALVRDAPFGQLVRFFTRNKVYTYPEERPDFILPSCYTDSIASCPDGDENAQQPPLSGASSRKDSAPLSDATPPVGLEEVEKAEDIPDLERAETLDESTLVRTQSNRSHLYQVGSRVALERAVTQADLELALSQSLAAERSKVAPIEAAKLKDGTVLVDWYTTDDPDNPQNWSAGKKGLVTLLVCIYTTAVYTGSAIYSPSVTGVEERFGVSPTAASLGLSLYVLAYGLGPLFFSPIQEIPLIGRNPPYMISFGIFVILTVPTALVDNFAGLLVLRFLQGFFGSPCLATGGATLQDMYPFIKLPYVLTCWAAAACVGPAMGPIISGFSVSAENWRWSLWEMLWLAGPVFLIMFFVMPETLPENILLRRASRIRRLTGLDKYRAASEFKKIPLKKTVVEALVRPIQLIVLDPAIFYADLYIALCYAIFYSFFEIFPLVYIGRYGFNVGQMGLTFLSITVAVIISSAGYFWYIHAVFEPEIRTQGLGAPERRLIPALFTSFLIPAGLFLFAWTGNGHIHWIVSCIGIVLCTIGIFILFQCMFVYLPLTYPAYSASLFAGNDFARSTLASGAILFARPLFLNLGIGPGLSLLAAFSAAFIAGIFVLYWYGHKLRARSRFAAK